MKNKSLFNKISLIISIVILFLILFLSVLGSFNRIGYLSEFKLISSKNKIYTYQFRIKYNSKVFRNSDIYGVYINPKNIINSNKYIRKITMNKVGSPFGILESNKKINSNIENIVYKLKLKKSIIISSLLLVMILLLHSIILDFIKRLSKFNFRNRYAYMVIIFLCFLIMPNIIYKVFYDKFDHTNYENRNKAKKPVFDINKLDKYPSLYEKYFNDYIPFRTELVQLKNLMDIFLFNNILDESVLLGNNKWLFHNEYIGFYNGKIKFSNSEFEKAKNNLLHFRDELRKINIDFVLMICPKNESIYTEYDPYYINRKLDTDIFDNFVEYIKKNTDIKVVYPKHELLKYKNKYQLYYKYDTHWNNIGAYIGYTELMKILNFNYVDLDDLTILKYDYRYRDTSIYYNDKAKMIGLSKIDYFRDDSIYVLKEYTNINNDLRNWNKKISFEYENYSNDTTIYVIKDSYMQHVADYLIPRFKKSYFIHLNDFKNYYITNKNIDILIFETVDVSLMNRILNLLPKYKIEEINKYSETN